VDVDAYKISAKRLGPARKASFPESTLERRIDGLELRPQQLAMCCHEAFDSGVIAQETHMPQLIEFVRPDRPHRASRYEPLDIGLRSGEQGESASCKGYLGGRGEDERSIGMTGF